jgi:hypothetical protein
MIHRHSHLLITALVSRFNSTGREKGNEEGATLVPSLASLNIPGIRL